MSSCCSQFINFKRVCNPFSIKHRHDSHTNTKLTFSSFPLPSPVRKEDRSSGAGPRRLSRQNSEGSLLPGEPREHTIDCGDIVWGLAFGSSVPEKQSRCVNIEWHRFKFGQDQLLLATGLNNGRIKIWEVYTGEGPLTESRITH